MIIPISKEGDNYRAILSDDSIDRDGEYISRQLIEKWAAQDGSLPLLADHDNTMDSFIGAWKDRKVIESQDGHVGLSMQPIFFSESANPKAQRIKKQIDEALSFGLNPGVSIGFIPTDGYKAERGYEHSDAEIVEASFVPVQSNRNAYAYRAKQFKITNTLLKESQVIRASGKMAENQTNAPDPMAAVMARMDKIEAGMQELAGRLSACEQATQTMTSSADANTKAEAEKRIELEKKIASQLETYKKEIQEAKNAAAQPRAKIPAALLGSSGVAKEPSESVEIFDAAKAVARKKGIDV